MKDTGRARLWLSACGVFSGLTLVGATLYAFLCYRGPYTLFNLTISELGLAAVSAAAQIFNRGLIVGGLGCCTFLIGIGRWLGRWSGRLLALTGGGAGFAAALVGVFPVDHPLHAVVGPACFLSAWFSSTLFTARILWKPAAPLGRWLAVPSSLVSLGTGLYSSMPLLLPDGMGQIFAAPASRPQFWLVAMSEWFAFAAICLWVMSVALALMASEVRSETRAVLHPLSAEGSRLTRQETTPIGKENGS